jgi:hypothetical protein
MNEYVKLKKKKQKNILMHGCAEEEKINWKKNIYMHRRV